MMDIWCIEENASPTSEADRFNTDLLGTIAARNRRLLRDGKQPKFVVIGVASSPHEAQKLLEEYKVRDYD